MLEKSGQPAAMLAAVPVKYGQHRGVWLCGAAGVQGVPMDRLLPKIMEGCLRAYGASGFDFAVTTPDDARRAEDLKTLGFKKPAAAAGHTDAHPPRPVRPGGV